MILNMENTRIAIVAGMAHKTSVLADVVENDLIGFVYWPATTKVIRQNSGCTEMEAIPRDR
jgi:hypothetical protein